MIFFFACNDDFQKENSNLNSNQEFAVTFDEEALVSLEFATNVAKTFLGGEIAKKGGTKSLASSSVETVEDKGNNPSMYVINYPEGGWVIVGATRNYYPILAYSEEGSFEIKPEAEMGGAFLWLEETKEAVRLSPALDDSTKVQMHDSWRVYETNDSKKPESSSAKNYTMMYNRISQLYNQYSSTGWTNYMSLENAASYLDYYTGQYLTDLANNFGADPEFTIVAVRNQSYTRGPLLTTQWNQNAPFNDLVPGNADAGCVTIAMAQVMRYFEHPKVTGSPIFDWDNMPNTALLTILHPNPATPSLINHIRNNLGGSTASLSTAKTVFENYYSYNATLQNHNSSTVRTSIYLSQPVIMRGATSSGAVGHAWVCDGNKLNTLVHDFFIEFFVWGTYNNYYTDEFGYSPYFPGTSLSGAIPIIIT